MVINLCNNLFNPILIFSFKQRFGSALVREGQINLKQSQYKFDMRPIDENCDCSTCKTYTRSYLHHIVTLEAVASTLLTVHNVAFQLRLMNDMRTTIVEKRFPEFIKDFMKQHLQDEPIPTWIKNALASVNVHL